MNGDFSRSTFRTYKQYSSVRMQQGRVQLDADWNEAEDIRAYIERTAYTDAIGRNGVPKKASGFAIGVTPDGADLTVGGGRIYIDGVLAELHSELIPIKEVKADRVVLDSPYADGRTLDAGQWIELSVGSTTVLVTIASVDATARALMLAPVLSAADVAALATGATLRRVVTYATQPDLPAPPMTSNQKVALGDGRYLVYADVWERHVTVLDDPDLRETALGGPDTSTRTKTVCQVRIEKLDDARIEHCDQAPDPVALLNDHGTRPTSMGRMQARAVPGDPGAEPCDLSAGGGYRRLENQLYRVEVHKSGPLSTATFKWSRDNASMTARWLGQVGSKLQVSSQGPDDVLGFASGQLVELIDDTRELAGTPGTLVTLSAPPEGNVLTVGSTVNRTTFPGNPKVRRWDCSAEVAIAGPAQADGWIHLEDGVEVRFDDGWYNTGDYWLIPARSSDGNVEWPRDAGDRPVPRGPDGIAHHYAKLALLRSDGGTITVMEDCRDLFPALSDLAALDVSYNNTECALPGVRTVQDALDQLCEDHTLRRHKKTLHGWGIVCGLQVACAGDDDGRRRAVIVRDGYAIDSEGNDLVLEKEERIDVVRTISDYADAHPDESPLLNEGDGEVSLFMRLDPDRGNLRLDIERFDPRSENDPQQLLADTMLMDFYKECILPVEKFFRAELTTNDEDTKLSPAIQRRAVLIGLTAHFLNQQSGQLIYVSAQEDEILRSFYERLKRLLSSETFCAMFESARPFPDYPLKDVPMTTIFGRGHHTRVRLRPGKVAEAYTVGPGFNLKGPTIAINRYDLKRGEYVASTDPVAGNRIEGKFKRGTNAVRDVAFSKDGQHIYAITPTRTGRDTFFRVGEIDQDDIRWGELQTICGVKLVTLGTTGKDPGNLYAVGVGSGLYRINPYNPDLSPSPIAAFNATGQMEVTEDGRALALGASDDAGRGIYDQLYAFSLPDGSPIFGPMSLDAQGRDDLTVATEEAGREAIYVAVGSGTRTIQAYDPRTGTRQVDSNKQPVSIEVGDGPVSLAMSPQTGTLLIAMEDAYRVRIVDATSMTLIDEFVPAQVGPASIAVDERTKAAYVLNAVSSTITVAGFDLLTPKLVFPYEALAAYRCGILDAFVDLTGGFLQYLKDCLCDHFLVRCPEPTGDEKIYLAAISLRNDEVYKVCNFSKRRYVKSFPAIGYWLSAVPLAPMIDRLVEAFCCWIIPDQFGRFASRQFEAETFAGAPSGRFAPSSLRTGAFAVQEFDPMSKTIELLMQLRLAAGQMFARFSPQHNNYAAPAPAPKPTEPPSILIGSKASDAAVKFANEGILVTKKPFRRGGDPLGILRATFTKPRPGDTVEILEEDGVVKGIAVFPATERIEIITQPAVVTQPSHETMTQPSGVVSQPTGEAVTQPPADLIAELNIMRSRLEAREAETNVLAMRLANMEGRHEILSNLVRARGLDTPVIAGPGTPVGRVIERDRPNDEPGRVEDHLIETDERPQRAHESATDKKKKGAERASTKMRAAEKRPRRRKPRG
jgi:uncharacterized protein DUF6519